MGAAIYPDFEIEIPELNAMDIIGKALCRNLEALDAIAILINVTPLSTLVDERTMREMMLGEDDPTAATWPPVQWYPAEEGLTIIQALLTGLQASAEDIVDLPTTIMDLQSVEKALLTAARKRVRFHLLVDI